MKAIIILIAISLVACNTSIVVLKGDSNEVHQKQKMDSIQLNKNEFKIPSNG